MNSTTDKAAGLYRENFRGEPVVVWSPGRINLIGEHTDYNDGLVLPAAIGMGIAVALQANGTAGVCRVLAADRGDFLEFDVHETRKYPGNAWQNYVLGAVHVLQSDKGVTGGFDAVITGNLPAGAGLSSSAALTNGLILGLNEISGLSLKRREMAQLAQRAEQEFTGLECGIMDQFAGLMGRQGHAILLDCRSLGAVYLPLDLGEYTLQLVQSGVSHELAATEYNTRRAECRTGVDLLQEQFPQVRSLRDADPAMLEAAAEHLPPLIYDRCQYVVQENLRVMQSAMALRRGDMERFGALLNEAHLGMRFLYDITCAEIDFLADTACAMNGVAGSRMMGGGFGGCTLNLVHRSAVETFRETLGPAYAKRFGLQPAFLEVSPEDGARVFH